MEAAEVIITGFSKPSSEGIILHFNVPARLKTGIGAFSEIWVSWDKIGEALISEYASPSRCDEIRDANTNTPNNH